MSLNTQPPAPATSSQLQLMSTQPTPPPTPGTLEEYYKLYIVS